MTVLRGAYHSPPPSLPPTPLSKTSRRNTVTSIENEARSIADPFSDPPQVPAKDDTTPLNAPFANMAGSDLQRDAATVGYGFQHRPFIQAAVDLFERNAQLKNEARLIDRQLIDLSNKRAGSNPQSPGEAAHLKEVSEEKADNIRLINNKYISNFHKVSRLLLKHKRGVKGAKNKSSREESDTDDTGSIRTLEYQTAANDPLRWNLEDRHPNPHVRNAVKDRRAATTTGHNTFAFPKIEVHSPQDNYTTSNLTTALNNNRSVSSNRSRAEEAPRDRPMPFSPRILEGMFSGARTHRAVDPTTGQYLQNLTTPRDKEDMEAYNRMLRTSPLLNGSAFSSMRNGGPNPNSNTGYAGPLPPELVRDAIRNSPLINQDPVFGISYQLKPGWEKSKPGESIGYPVSGLGEFPKCYEEMLMKSPLFGGKPIGYNEDPALVAAKRGDEETYYRIMREREEEKRGRPLQRGEDMYEGHAEQVRLLQSNYEFEVDDTSINASLELDLGTETEMDYLAKQVGNRMELYKMVYERACNDFRSGDLSAAVLAAESLLKIAEIDARHHLYIKSILEAKQELMIEGFMGSYHTLKDIKGVKGLRMTNDNLKMLEKVKGWRFAEWDEDIAESGEESEPEEVRIGGVDGHKPEEVADEGDEGDDGGILSNNSGLGMTHDMPAPMVAKNTAGNSHDIDNATHDSDIEDLNDDDLKALAEFKNRVNQDASVIKEGAANEKVVNHTEVKGKQDGEVVVELKSISDMQSPKDAFDHGKDRMEAKETKEVGGVGINIKEEGTASTSFFASPSWSFASAENTANENSELDETIPKVENQIPDSNETPITNPTNPATITAEPEISASQPQFPVEQWTYDNLSSDEYSDGPEEDDDDEVEYYDENAWNGREYHGEH